MSHRPRGRATLTSAGMVAAGGMIGTAARATAEAAFPAMPGAIPWTTFVINVMGSLLLGALLETLALGGPDEGRRRVVRLACGTGVLGGFTTYSTFVAETEQLLSGGAPLTGVGYAVASVAIGVSSAVVGILAARRLRRGDAR